MHFCPGTGDSDVDSLIALGVEHGCEFSAEDLAADAELSDEQLEAVAGGVALAGFALKGPKIGGGRAKFRLNYNHSLG